MSDCCVSGCNNQCFPNSTLKFYRIPLKPKRRRLWLQALQQVNGSTEGLNGHVRICGAHFISGEASMDHNSPDFVPSVFTSIQSTPKKKVNRLFGHRRRRHHKINVSEEEVPASAPAEPKGEETLTKEPEDETRSEPVTSETKSSPVKSFQSLKLPPGFSKLDKSPVVLIKPLCLPAGQYQLDLSSQNLTGVYNGEQRSIICENCGKQYTSRADYNEHKCFQNVPKDKPSFPCNMCDKFFTTSHNLKRHKLLHVRDGRKCSKCGVLFCQRHRHVLYVPQVEPMTEHEQDSSADELQAEGSDVMPENSSLQESEQMETDDVDDDSVTETPVLTPAGPAPPPNPPALSILFTGALPVPNTIILPPNAIPLFRKPFPVLLPRPPVPGDSKNPSTSLSQPPPPEPPGKPITFAMPDTPSNVELPASLKIFSPKFLTSALLEVKRNYEYILGKGVKEVPIVKEEPCELPVVAPPEQSVDHDQSPQHEQNVAHEQSSEQVKKERTAYDLEIEI